jgi:hypothetical protein
VHFPVDAVGFMPYPLFIERGGAPPDKGECEMAKRFENLPELSADLAFALIERLADRDDLNVQFGASNQSCSRYVNIDILDEDGDYVEEFKVRFSDHDDRHGSDITIRIDHLVSDIEEGGEFVAVEIGAEAYEAALAEAEAAIGKFIAE